MVDVPAALLKKHSAVSEEVARSLAENGLKKMPNPVHSICISTTGIAGPDGGTTEKPVGLCYIALARPGQATIVEKIIAPKGLDRLSNKGFFPEKALELVQRKI